MRILVANNHLVITGGSENFTYALAEELLRQNFEVEYFCDPAKRGKISQCMEQKLGIRFKSHDHYDLILANHNTMVEMLDGCGTIIQTCHGVYPPLEQPSPCADAYVVISQEVQDHLTELGVQSTLILNGIDCQKFYPATPLHATPQSVLSLCQGDEANAIVKEACEELGLHHFHASKSTNNIIDIQDYINQADMVFGVGRSLYDAMACGRTCISYDSRAYSSKFDGHDCGGDGYITLNNIDQSIINNCTGRGVWGRHFDKDGIIEEIKRYDKLDGDKLRKYALKHLNMKINVGLYLKIHRRIKFELLIDSWISYILGSRFAIYNRVLQPQKSLPSRVWKSIKEILRGKK